MVSAWAVAEAGDAHGVLALADGAHRRNERRVGADVDESGGSLHINDLGYGADGRKHINCRRNDRLGGRLAHLALALGDKPLEGFERLAVEARGGDGDGSGGHDLDC